MHPGALDTSTVKQRIYTHSLYFCPENDSIIAVETVGIVMITV